MFRPTFLTYLIPVRFANSIV